jgi:hypothetical protein
MTHTAIIANLNSDRAFVETVLKGMRYSTHPNFLRHFWTITHGEIMMKLAIQAQPIKL